MIQSGNEPRSPGPLANTQPLINWNYMIGYKSVLDKYIRYSITVSKQMMCKINICNLRIKKYLGYILIVTKELTKFKHRSLVIQSEIWTGRWRFHNSELCTNHSLYDQFSVGYFFLLLTHPILAKTKNQILLFLCMHVNRHKRKSTKKKRKNKKENKANWVVGGMPPPPPHSFFFCWNVGVFSLIKKKKKIPPILFPSLFFIQRKKNPHPK